MGATHLPIDHNAQYATSFNAVFEAQEIEVLRVDPRAPNRNAFAKRWVQTLRVEVLGHRVREFVMHYNRERLISPGATSLFPTPTKPSRES